MTSDLFREVLHMSILDSKDDAVVLASFPGREQEVSEILEYFDTSEFWEWFYS